MNLKPFFIPVGLIFLLVLACGENTPDEASRSNWPSFRGVNATGISDNSTI